MIKLKPCPFCGCENIYADFDCEHCKHLKPSNKTNRLFCSYHSEGEHQYEVFKDEYCSYFERAESSREGAGVNANLHRP
jgi:hypothetical protein